jgi:tetratricopeptide (TPR) repeat protein
MAKIKFNLILALTFCFVLFAKADVNSSKESFNRANEFYAAQNYEEAITEYQKILDQGLESGNVYFNLGNAYFKTNNIGKAILHYEKAKKLEGENEDLNFNLRRAQLEIVDQITPMPQLLIGSWLKAFYQYFKSSTWGNVIIFSFALTLLFLGLRKWTSLLPLGFAKGFMVASIVIFGISLWAGLKRLDFERQDNFGVILSTNVYVKSAPDEGSTDLFVIHEGLKIQLTDQVGTWKQIRLADGKKGWITVDNLGVI